MRERESRADQCGQVCTLDDKMVAPYLSQHKAPLTTLIILLGVCVCVCVCV